MRGSYKVAERVFVLMTIPFFAYPIAAILARPDWGHVGHAIVAPTSSTTHAYLFLFIATAGTTITPFMQLYVQSAVVERGVGHRRARTQSDPRSVTGSIFANLIAIFIIIATGATLYVHGEHDISSAAEAAKALEPFAGRYAEVLFGNRAARREPARRRDPADHRRLRHRRDVRLREGHQPHRPRGARVRRRHHRPDRDRHARRRHPRTARDLAARRRPGRQRRPAADHSCSSSGGWPPAAS